MRLCENLYISNSTRPMTTKLYNGLDLLGGLPLIQPQACLVIWLSEITWQIKKMCDWVLVMSQRWTHDAYNFNTLHKHLHKHQIPLLEKCPYTEVFSQYFPEFSPNTGKADREKIPYYWSVRSRINFINENTAQKMKFSIKHFFSKCDQIRCFLRIWPHLLKKSLIETFIFCAVEYINQTLTLSELYLEPC